MTIYKTKNIIESFKYALAGIALVLIRERNLRIHFIIAILVIILSLLLHITAMEWIVVILCITIIFFAEMVNTAVESIIDLNVGDSYSKIAKEIKDISAGSVFLTAIGVALAGSIIFVPKFINLILNFI